MPPFAPDAVASAHRPPSLTGRLARSTAWSLQVQRYGVWILVGTFLMLLWAGVASAALFQRQRLLQQSTTELSQLNGAVSLQTVGLFNAIETALKVTDHWLQDFDGVDPVNNPRFVELVERLRDTTGGLFEVRVVSATGELRNVPNPTGLVVGQVADRDYFIAHQNSLPRRIYFGAPEISYTTGKWQLPVSWRTEGNSPKAQVVLAAVDLEILASTYEDLRIKPEGSIVLMHRDGRALTRAPFNADFVGRNVREPSTVEGVVREGRASRGTLISDSAGTDGVRRIVAFDHLQDYPLSVLTTRGVDAVLSDYFSVRNNVLAVCAALSLLALLLTALIHRAQRALEAARRGMQQLALVDDLTGLMNRRAFIDQARREFARSQRAQRACSVLVLDIDHFKKVNDQHGHLIGDQVLRDCANAWRAVMRHQDLLGRMGGEEFCVVLPDLGLQDAAQVAERLRHLTSGLGFGEGADSFHVTVSLGVAERRPEDTDWSQMYERADQALYGAKGSGRDQVVRTQ